MILTNITSARISWLLAAAAWLAPVAAAAAEPAQEPAADTAALPDAAAAPVEPRGPKLVYQTGDIVLPNKIASLHLGADYRYLDTRETEKLLLAWGNPEGSGTEGAIVPADVDPFGDGGWAVILTYKDEGHIDDSDAAKLDYDDMLKDMRSDEDEVNEARKQAKYPAIHLVGWAEKPHYDSTTKKLYWAKEINFADSPTHTLNYDVRVLGRAGVLSMNAVASMDQLAQIRHEMKPLIEVAEFTPGNRYAEFNSKTDKLAEYGLGALIAGGVAAKLGLFAKFGAILLAAKKFVIMGVVALGGLLARVFGKKKDTTI
jgi:uncharacterized membrane-anchored protein